MPPQPRLNAVAFVSPLNHPILIRTFAQPRQDELKYHYIAHTSLDVIEERVASAQAARSTECYLGLLYSMEDVAVYGYVTPLRVKIVLAVALTDSVVRDVDVVAIARAMHTAYRYSVANPFLKLNMPLEGVNDHAAMLSAGSAKWRAFRRRVDDVGRLLGAPVSSTSAASVQSH